MKYRCKRCRALLSKPQLATHRCTTPQEEAATNTTPITYEFVTSPSTYDSTPAPSDNGSPYIVETNSSDNCTSGGGTFDGGGASGDW